MSQRLKRIIQNNLTSTEDGWELHDALFEVVDVEFRHGSTTYTILSWSTPEPNASQWRFSFTCTTVLRNNMMIMMVQMSLRRLQPDRFESLIFSSLEKNWLFASKHSKQFSVGRMNTPLPIPSGPTCPLLTQSGPGGTSKASKKISALIKKTRWFTVSPAQHIQMFLTGLFRLSSGLNTLSTFVTGYDWVLEGVSESKLIKLESCS